MLEILQSKWKEILNYIKQEYDISDVSFDTWLMPLKLYDVKDNTVIIMVEEKLAVNYVNRRFNKFFKVTITEFIGDEYEIKFISPDDVSNGEYSPKEEKSSIDEGILNIRIAEANLNPKYTFDTFVVGGSNNFAHAYALKVAEAPGEIWRRWSWKDTFNALYSTLYS